MGEPPDMTGLSVEELQWTVMNGEPAESLAAFQELKRRHVPFLEPKRLSRREAARLTAKGIDNLTPGEWRAVLAHDEAVSRRRRGRYWR